MPLLNPKENIVKAMKGRLQIFIRLTLRQLMKVFWIFPVRKNKVLLESYGGAFYSCNPKYLSEHLEKQHPGRYDLVWSFTDPDSISDLSCPHRFRVVRRHSIRFYYEYLTSGVRITNSPNQLTFYPKRKNQLVLNTWHAGGAYKRTGIASEHVQKQDAFEKWSRRTQASLYDLFLSSSPVFTRTNIREAYGYTGPVLESGMPRNDIFFNSDRVSSSSEKVRTTLGVEGFVVLYAPTYRGGSSKPTASLPVPAYAIKNGVQSRFGRSATILVRDHYFYVKTASNSSEKSFPDDIMLIDVSGYPDMQELLCAADILITDYSSCIWDYALLGRPCFLYTPDLAEYEKEDRGFFTPINEWPGIVCRNEDELLSEIGNLNEEFCYQKAKEHLEHFQSYEAGKACERVERAIRGFIETGKLE